MHADYLRLKHVAAIRFFSMRVIDIYSESKSFMLSCKLAPSAIKTLIGMLVRSVPREDALDGWYNMEAASSSHTAQTTEATQKATIEGMLESLQSTIVSESVFSVAEDAPGRRKIPLAGSLSNIDIDISLHQPLDVRDDGQVVLVSQAPLNLDPIAGRNFGGVHASSLVLIPSALPLEALIGARQWRMKDVLHFTLPGWPTLLECDCERSQQESLRALVSTRGLDLSAVPDHVHEKCLASLQDLQREDIVHQHADRWRFTNKGRSMLSASATLESPKRLMQVREVAVTEFTYFELFQALEDGGWVVNVAHDNATKKVAKGQPYEHGKSKKEWWMRAEPVLEDINKPYLRLLLQATEGCLPIPHFAASSTYTNMLDPTRQDRLRQRHRRLVCAADDDWDLIPEKKKKTRPVKERIRAPRAEGSGGIARRPRKRKIENRSPTVSASSSSQSSMACSDDKSSCSYSSESLLEPEPRPEDRAELGELEPTADAVIEAIVPPAEVEPTAGAVVETIVPPIALAIEPPPLPPPLQPPPNATVVAPASPASPAWSARSAGSRASGRAGRSDGFFLTVEPWGRHQLTQRWTALLHTGYQMRCNNPEHNQPGQICTREVGISSAGDLAGCRRLLKAWALLGSSQGTRADHMSAAWRGILLGALKDGAMMSEAELDNLSHQDLKEDEFEMPAPFVVPPDPQPFATAAPAAKSAKKKKGGSASGASSSGAGSGSANILGERHPDVPEEAHASLEELARAGVIPRTTLAQRTRNAPTRGSCYAVPAFLAVARDYHYIAPSLPPPRNFQWVSRAGSWRLRFRGG